MALKAVARSALPVHCAALSSQKTKGTTPEELHALHCGFEGHIKVHGSDLLYPQWGQSFKQHAANLDKGAQEINTTPRFHNAMKIFRYKVFVLKLQLLQYVLCPHSVVEVELIKFQ